MTKRLPPPAEWAEQYSEAWRALCEGRAAVMPIDRKRKCPRTGQPVKTESNLAFRLDVQPKRKPKGYAP